MVYSRTHPEDIDDSSEQHLVDALRHGLGRKKMRCWYCLCAGFELFVGFQMDNSVAELEAAFADLHLEFRHYPRIGNPTRVPNHEKYRLELVVALYHRQCLVQRMVASFRHMQSSIVNKRAR